MRKRIIKQSAAEALPADDTWLDLERLVEVEVTSEEAAYPIESALLAGTVSGWRAVEPGEQSIRIRFDKPQRLKHIFLFFQEEEARTQEFVLRWAPEGGQSYREIVRQQYNFSPPGATREVENYSVDLDEVVVFELSIVPDVSGGHARASLEQLRLARAR